MVSSRRGSQPHDIRADEFASLKPAVGVTVWTNSRGVERVALAPTPSFSLQIEGPHLAINSFFEAYFEGEDGPLPLLNWGNLTPFTRTVLEALQHLPFGKKLTYGELAARIGCPRGARAVGGALGANPFPLLIPCHRIVARNGLGGFSAGCLDIKETLLNYESLF